jgi:arylsulfatase A-like enzyme
MDRLVESGTALTHCHIMGSMDGAVCVPSRAMLMTGRHLFSLRQRGKVIPREHTTLPQVLRSAGYTTFCTGKWHQDKDTFARSFDLGRDVFFGGMSDHFNMRLSDFESGIFKQVPRSAVEGKHSSETFSDAAIDFLRTQNGRKPWFLYVSYTAPHDPRHMPRQYRDMYEAKQIRLPRNFMREHPFDNGEMWIRDEKLATWPRSEQEIKRHICDYHAMITHVDAQIGCVLDVLDATNTMDNTIIVFAGDNGLAVGSHGLMGKQNLYDHSVRVPLVFCGPRIPRGQRRGHFCYLHDVFPTLCDLLGVGVPTTVQSKSLVPMIRNGARPYGSIFAAYRHFQRMVRTDNWKLIRYYQGVSGCDGGSDLVGTNHTQLFDMAADPWELQDVSRESAHSPRVAEMKSLLAMWQKELGDPLVEKI